MNIAQNNLMLTLQRAFKNITFTEVENVIVNMGDERKPGDGKSRLFGDTRLYNKFGAHCITKDGETLTKAELETIVNNVSYSIAGNRRFFNIDIFSERNENTYFIQLCDCMSIISYLI